MRPVTRRAQAILGALAASMALVVVTGPVAAASPQPVTFTIDMHWEVGEGTFDVTSGGGSICDSGTVVDTQLIFGGYQSGQGVQILVRKAFICDDGVFFLKMQVHANPDGTEVFSWVIQGGTGEYEKLGGSGDGTTVPGAPGYNKAFFTGFLIG